MYPKFRPQPGAHERSAFIQPRQPNFRGPRPAGPAEPPKNLASALRVKNFRHLLEVAGEEQLAVALDITMHRIRELGEGVNFSSETTHHIETTLGLTSGFMDQVNPTLTAEDIQRLKSAPKQEDSAESVPPQPPTPEPTPSVSLVVNTVQKEAPVARPKKQDSRTPADAGASAPASAAHAEEGLRDTRRLNLLALTAQPGSKSQLARLTGLSAANISHRLHGNKIFDKETADFFCQRLNLPENWFELPRTAADVPDATKAILGAQGGAPRAAAPKARGPRKSKTSIVATAPTKGEAAKVSMSAAALGKPTAPVAGKSLAAKASPTPMLAKAGPVVAAPAPARAPAATLTQEALEGENVVVGPIAEALVRTLAAKSRNGALSEDRALQLLVEIAAL